MSMSISKQKIADEQLTYAEAMYLQKRGRLPKGYPIPEAPKAEDVDEAPVKKRSKTTPVEEQEVPKIEANGGIVEEDDAEEYEEGWNNNQRRAELSRRGLSVNGNKDELIARLRRDDSGELIDGDESEV